MKGRDVTGVILAGGASRRFCEDKVWYPVNGRPMIAHVYWTVRGVVPEVRISGRGTRGLPVIEDKYPGAGPLAGLHAALCEVAAPWVLLVASDMPFLTGGILLEVIEARTHGVRAVVARTSEGRLHPLCACYRRDILPIVEEQLRRGRLSMHDLLCELGEVRMVDVPSAPLRNVNRKADLLTLPHASTTS